MHKQYYIDRCFKALLLFIMIFALSMGIKDYFDMELSLVNLALYDLAIVLAVTLLYCFPRLFALGIFISSIPLIYIKYYYSQVFDGALRDILLFFQWLPAYIVGYTIFLEEYAVPLLITILIFATIILAVFVFSKINKLIIAAIGIIVFSLFWFTYVEKAHLYLMIYLFSSLILHSYNLWEKKKKEWNTSDSHVSISFYKSWIGSALLLIGFSIMFMLLLPLNIRPLRAMALNDFMMQSFPFIEQWKNNSEENYGYSFRFSLSDAGYKGKKLGGPVSYNGSHMLSLRGNIRNNLYLRGSVYDKYSGFNWSKSRKASKPYDENTQINLPAKAKFREQEIEIIHERMNASTLFNVLYPTKIEYERDKVFINEDLEVYARRLVDNNSSYKIKSKILVLSQDMLRYGVFDADDNIDKMYLKLPQNIPDRVKDLVEELSIYKNNSYDKAKSIEDYLRKNYSYTLEPKRVPEGKDFVDYFLFEQKEGYCTYYASSMTVMLRLAGIPSRYVEGFMVKSEGEGTKTYNLIDRNAHAWVEAYLGEYGWVTFEPTPAYEQVQPWESWEDENIDEASTNDTDSRTSFSEGILNISREKELMEEDIYIGDDANMGVNNKGVFIKSIIFIFIMLVSLRILYGIIRINILKFITSKNSKKFAEIYIKQIIWLMGRTDKKKSDSETFREFINSVSTSFEIDKSSFEYIVSTVESILYGDKAIKAEDGYKLKKFAETLKQGIKGNLGMTKYIWNLYLGKL